MGRMKAFYVVVYCSKHRTVFFFLMAAEAGVPKNENKIIADTLPC